MKALGLAVIAGMWASVAAGQVVENPTTVQFTPSSDHDTIVKGYRLRLYMEEATEPYWVVELGKPTPVENNVSLYNPAWFLGAAYDVVMYATVSAYGDAGESESLPSNPWMRVQLDGAPTAPVVLEVVPRQEGGDE